MIAYVLSGVDLSIKDVLEFEQYELQTDLEFNNKSTIKTVKRPNIVTDDFVWCKDGNDTLFVGICKEFTSESEKGEYSIKLAQKECLFDRFIFPADEALMATSIEGFIKACIEDNWVDSGDELMDKSYMSVNAMTTTPVFGSVSTIAGFTDGAINLKTFLGNCKERYGVYLDYVFADGHLDVNIYVDDADEMQLDVTVSDISEYTETYDVNVLARLIIRNSVDGTLHKFYLKNDRTITQDGTDPDRADGYTSSKEVNCEGVDDADATIHDEAIAMFKSNSYNHKVSFELLRTSSIYPISEIYVGRTFLFKSRDGIKNSMLTQKIISSQKSTVSLAFGKLPVTLIDKIRRAR